MGIFGSELKLGNAKFGCKSTPLAAEVSYECVKKGTLPISDEFPPSFLPCVSTKINVS
jgi:hypothetical protein